jgi:phosphoglycerate dehydrogenase-like enzyme
MGRVKASTSSVSLSKDVLLVTDEIQPGEIAKRFKELGLHERYPNIHVEILPNDSSLDSLAPETLRATKYLLGFNNFPKPEQVPNLELVQLFSAGSNHLHNHPLWTWKQDEVKWSSASGVHGPIIGEYVVMAILTHFHRYLTTIDAFQGVGRWPKQWPLRVQPPARELFEHTVGIIGYGAIGRNIAKLLRGFNVEIITLNSTRKSTPEERLLKDWYTVPGTGDIPGDIPSKWYSSSDPEEKKVFFQEADVVVVTAPYTPATERLVDAMAIGHMKKTSLIVNIARGALIDQDALVKALKEKKIAGASLDVFTPEPYPSDGALLTDFGDKEDRERVILTPHVSGNTPHYTERVIEIAVENLDRLEKGKPILNFIDRRKGFRHY